MGRRARWRRILPGGNCTQAMQNPPNFPFGVLGGVGLGGLCMRAMHDQPGRPYRSASQM